MLIWQRKKSDLLEAKDRISSAQFLLLLLFGIAVLAGCGTSSTEIIEDFSGVYEYQKDKKIRISFENSSFIVEHEQVIGRGQYELYQSTDGSIFLQTRPVLSTFLGPKKLVDIDNSEGSIAQASLGEYPVDTGAGGVIRIRLGERTYDTLYQIQK
ncbi:hypothetical protein [Kordiimonas aestuarii]|uniref:hypothetical protein n=1 Tax=Kordiimonas aestuarii TaxID=1005925 RepID=UPI0021CE4FBC|nr:hypothetical protein [Kordiimonas aestuarii]